MMLEVILTQSPQIPMPGEIVNLSAPGFFADPYPTLARLRREAPVCRVKGVSFHTNTGWLVSRYEDVASVLKDPRLVNDRRNLTGGESTDRLHQPRALQLLQKLQPRMLLVLQNTMLVLDDPAHARARGLAQKAFTPRMIEELAPKIQSIADSLLDEATKKPMIDLIEDFALPLPLIVISEMLGIPEAERFKFRKLVTHLLDSSPSNISRIAVSLFGNWQLIRYLDRLVELRRREPDGGLISAMLAAEEAGDRLTGDDVTGVVFILLVAGHETTMNLIGSGMLALLDNPDQLAALHKTPALAKSAVEELLRFTNPIMHGVTRFAREDLEIGGVTIPKHSFIIAMLSSANRDETVFSEADKLILARDPNRHVAFGVGIHYCLGAPLARLEGAIALNALVQRFPNLKLAIGREKVKWRSGGTLLRGLTALPVRLSG
jgi:cytochrome P450